MLCLLELHVPQVSPRVAASQRPARLLPALLRQPQEAGPGVRTRLWGDVLPLVLVPAPLLTSLKRLSSLQCTVLAVPDNGRGSEPGAEDVVHGVLDLLTDH